MPDDRRLELRVSQEWLDALDEARGDVPRSTFIKAAVTINPVALQKPQAAAALNISVDSFDRYVGPHVRCVRRGSLRLYPIAELERWVNENAEPLL